MYRSTKKEKLRLTLKLLELWRKWKSRRASEAPTATGLLVGKTWVASQEREGKEVTTPVGGSHWKHQETVRFPHARSTHVTGEHFLSPWLQETGQGCASFRSWGAGRRARLNTWDDAASDWLFAKKGRGELWQVVPSVHVLNIWTTMERRLFRTFVVFVNWVDEITHTVVGCQVSTLSVACPFHTKRHPLGCAGSIVV